jgi:hypothetical protein
MIYRDIREHNLAIQGFTRAIRIAENNYVSGAVAAAGYVSRGNVYLFQGDLEKRMRIIAGRSIWARASSKRRIVLGESKQHAPSVATATPSSPRVEPPKGPAPATAKPVGSNGDLVWQLRSYALRSCHLEEGRGRAYILAASAWLCGRLLASKAGFIGREDTLSKRRLCGT